MENGSSSASIMKRLLALIMAAVLLLCPFGARGTLPSEREALASPAPTEAPSQEPAITDAPTEAPTEAPSITEEAVTPVPTEEPTEAPTAEPVKNTETPEDTPKPTAKPTDAPKPTESGAATPSPKPTATPVTTPKATNTPKPDPAAFPTPAPPVTGLPREGVMMCVGDLMCLSAQQYVARNQASGGEKYDFRPSFELVRALFSRADCTVGNLETVISPSAPYTAQQTHIGGKPNCNSPAEYLAALKYAGFDALALANNHCCDAGLTGITETLDAVDRAGFIHTGLFAENGEERFAILDVNGIKVGLLSYSEFFNGFDVPIVSDGYGYMLNRYYIEAVRRDVAYAKAKGAEFIVVYEHWGREYIDTPTDNVRKHAQLIADAGADVICGSHSHCLQTSAYITAADGRNVLCMYSLGNFVSSMSRSICNDTVVLELKLRRDEAGTVTLSEEIFHPCRVIHSFLGKGFVVVPTDYDAVPSVRSQLAAAEERILAILNTER